MKGLGGRVAWSATVVFNDQCVAVLHIYDELFFSNVGEDAAQVAYARIRLLKEDPLPPKEPNRPTAFSRTYDILWR